MRALLVAAFVAAPHLAVAGDLANLDKVMRTHDPAVIATLFADRVDVQIAIETPTCARLAGVVARDKVVPCLLALAGSSGFAVTAGIGSPDPMLVGHEDLAFAATLRAGKITTLGPVAPSGADAKLPTTFGQLAMDFSPSKALAAALDKKGGSVAAIHKVCVSAAGAITSRRLVARSGDAAFDKESTAWAARIPALRQPFKPFATAIAFCDLVTVSYPNEADGVEGGEAGGVEGGVVGGDMTAPPPPPPPPPQNVAPALLESFRIAGDKLIAPDDDTKRAIAASGTSKLVASFKLCISTDGAVAIVKLLKSSGFDAYDAKLHAAIERWTYRPYVINGRAVPVCTAVTFVYSQEDPAPPPPPRHMP